MKLILILIFQCFCLLALSQDSTGYYYDSEVDKPYESNCFFINLQVGLLLNPFPNSLSPKYPFVSNKDKTNSGRGLFFADPSFELEAGYFYKKSQFSINTSNHVDRTYYYLPKHYTGRGSSDVYSLFGINYFYKLAESKKFYYSLGFGLNLLFSGDKFLFNINGGGNYSIDADNYFYFPKCTLVYNLAMKGGFRLGKKVSIEMKLKYLQSFNDIRTERITFNDDTYKDKTFYVHSRVMTFTMTTGFLFKF